MPKAKRKTGIKKREATKDLNDKFEIERAEAKRKWDKMTELQRAEYCESIAYNYEACPQKEAVLAQARRHRAKCTQ